MTSKAIPVDYNPFPDMEPGGFPLTSQDQASRMVDQASRAVMPLVDPFLNLGTLAGRALYGPESEGWDKYGPATPEDAAKGALLVTMPSLGRAAIAGGVERDLMSMGGAADKPPMPARPANDPALTGPERTGSYRTAQTDQAFNKYVNESTDIRDWRSWQNVADAEDIKLRPDHTYTNANAAAKKYSEGGKTTVYIGPDGQRYLYHDGEKIIVDKYSDLKGMGGAGEIPRMQQVGAKYATENLSRLGPLKPNDLRQLIADAQSGKVVRHLSEKDGQQYKAGMIDVYKKALADSGSGTY